MKSTCRQWSGAFSSTGGMRFTARRLFNDDVFFGHVIMETFATGFDGLDFVDHIGAGQYFSEDGVAPTLHAGGGVVQNPLSATLMKNWAVAECGSPVRAIATV